MHKTTLLLGLLALLLGSPAPAEAANDTPGGPTAFALELADGSRIRGTVALDVLRLTSPILGEIEVPTNQLVHVSFHESPEGARLYLENGDVLTGALSISEIELEALFGTATIPLHVLLAM